ncbi:hypothetical protein [Pseudomonas arsenicoxydans]|uniref:Lipoprotein n=1 Tax=Pseudomonas arsenicoxydans TaxID=702115 RepID=A0A502HUM2_9PSED|nr:hypothetical protein [Pseudomonas arsenicoxydans]TPG78271.1 hypothetical protein EAH78_11850 [Pseudomonas arsenicoxydans]
MKLSTPLSALMITASLFGCTHSSHQSMNLALAATQRNPGHTATTTLTSVGNQTNFDFYITGVPSGTILPPRIYTFINKGSCQQPGPAAFAMNDKVNTEPNAGTGGWTFYRSAPIKMPDLLSGKYSIVVRTSPEDGSADIFCGDVAHATR